MWDSLEDDHIAFFPYAPSGKHEDLREHGGVPPLFSTLNELQSIPNGWPGDAKRVPAPLAKGAVEE